MLSLFLLKCYYFPILIRKCFIILHSYAILFVYSNSPHDGNMIKTHAIGSPGSLNTSLDLNQITSNVAENFSAEMNAWYQNHEHQMDNNNTTVPASKIRSTATLV